MDQNKMENNLEISNDQKSSSQQEMESETSSLDRGLEFMNITNENRAKVYYSEDLRIVPSDSTSIVSDSSDGLSGNLTDSEASYSEMKRKYKKVSNYIL